MQAKYSELLQSILFLATIGCASGARAEVMCPDSLDVQQKVVLPSDRWTVNYSTLPMRLLGVQVFDGQPANRVELKPDKRKSTANELQVNWNLPESPRSYYLQCSYERTTGQVVTALPPGARYCMVIYDRRTTSPMGGLTIKRMVCE